MRSTDLTTAAGLRTGLLEESAALVELAEGLDPSDWSRLTRVERSTVLDAVNLGTERLRRFDVELTAHLHVDAPHGTPAATADRALADLRTAYDAMVAALEGAGSGPDDPGPYDSALLGTVLAVALARNDVLHALGAEQALPDASAAIAAQAVPGILAGLVFQGVARPPGQPIGYRLAAPSTTTAIWSAGDGWQFGEHRAIKLCNVNADDSSMLLFVTGRIGPRDLRLWVTGERDLVWLFKDYFPGQ
ncbi:MAG: hypothetical protein U0V73_15675 [Acidimicrobiia bacterium]